MEQTHRSCRPIRRDCDSWRWGNENNEVVLVDARTALEIALHALLIVALIDVGSSDGSKELDSIQATNLLFSF